NCAQMVGNLVGNAKQFDWYFGRPRQPIAWQMLGVFPSISLTAFRLGAEVGATWLSSLVFPDSSRLPGYGPRARCRRPVQPSGGISAPLLRRSLDCARGLLEIPLRVPIVGRLSRSR